MSDPDTLWKEWEASPSPRSLSSVVSSLSEQVDKIIASNPSISPTLLRSKSRNMLIGAVKSYDPTFGASLKTHAYNYLKPLSSRGYTLSRAVPRTRYREDIARSLHNELTDSEQRGEEEPNAKELARRLKLPIGTVEHFLSGRAYEIPEGSIESSPVGKDSDDGGLSFWTEMVYNDLSPIQKKIFDMRSGKDGQNLTLGQVAKATGVSSSYAHKVTTDATSKIMKGMNEFGSSKNMDLEDEPANKPGEAADFLNVPLF